MSKPDKNGVSLRQHLQVVEDQTGTTPAQLVAKDAGIFHYIFAHFCEVSAGRGSGFGPCPLSWVEIDAWIRLRKLHLTIFEVDLIRLLDNNWLKWVSEQKSG